MHEISELEEGIRASSKAVEIALEKVNKISDELSSKGGDLMKVLQEGVDSIKGVQANESDLDRVKSLEDPPECIANVLAACSIMLGSEVQECSSRIMQEFYEKKKHRVHVLGNKVTCPRTPAPPLPRTPMPTLTTHLHNDGHDRHDACRRRSNSRPSSTASTTT